MYLDKIVQVMKNDYPLFKNLKLYGFYNQLSEDELNYVFSGIFGKPVQRKIQSIYDNHNEIYYEDSYGDWIKIEYDENGNKIYSENFNGYWWKKEYDENGNEIYSVDSNGYWWKKEYDKRGKEIYFEDSDGYIEDYRWKR